MPEVLIAGAGLTGLACAYHLLTLGLEPSKVELLDARQELGSPNRSSGLLLDRNRAKPILDYLDCEQINMMDLGENRFGLRREWLEKSLGVQLTKAGVLIGLKKRIDSFKVIPTGISLSINRGKEIIEVLAERGVLVDALGDKPSSSGFPGDSNILRELDSNAVIRTNQRRDIQEWTGALIPAGDEYIQLSSTHASFLRADGLREEWTRSTLPYDTKGDRWTEIIPSHHPSSIDEFSVDVAFERGLSLAEAVLSNPLLSRI